MVEDLLNNIKDLRKAKGYTQSELADKVGVKLRQVQRWEAGEGLPEKKHLDKLVEVLEYVTERRNINDVNANWGESTYNDILLGITESNRILAESNKLAMENNSKLVETNNMLIVKLINLGYTGEVSDASVEKKQTSPYHREFESGLDKEEITVVKSPGKQKGSVKH